MTNANMAVPQQQELRDRVFTCLGKLDAEIEKAERWMDSDAWDELTDDQKYEESLRVVNLRRERDRLEFKAHQLA